MRFVHRRRYGRPATFPSCKYQAISRLICARLSPVVFSL